MQKVAVLIPVFQTSLSGAEQFSLRRTFQILGAYPIVLVCPANLEKDSYYGQVAKSCGVKLLYECFDPHYFEGIEGYNRLLLTEDFYLRFREFEFVLICQTDAFVFRDELLVWCEKSYDFIGAPLFGKFTDVEFHSDQSRVGNGGFSLRRVQAYLDFFQGKKHVFRTKDIAKYISFRKKPYTRWLVWLLMVMGWRNKPQSVARHWEYNEDDFWSSFLDDTNYSLNKPLPMEAMRFAFERFPIECYAMAGGLPFGCHAWKKYQFEEFWKGIIEFS
jgi:hypothetical protein